MTNQATNLNRVWRQQNCSIFVELELSRNVGWIPKTNKNTKKYVSVWKRGQQFCRYLRYIHDLSHDLNHLDDHPYHLESLLMAHSPWQRLVWLLQWLPSTGWFLRRCPSSVYHAPQAPGCEERLSARSWCRRWLLWDCQWSRARAMILKASMTLHMIRSDSRLKITRSSCGGNIVIHTRSGERNKETRRWLQMCIPQV